MKDIYEALIGNYQLSGFHCQRDDLYFITSPKEQIVSLLKDLRDRHNFTHLVFMTVVDWMEENKFQVTYMLFNYETKLNLGVKVFLDRTEPIMDSIHPLWEQARVYQRELYEMFGISFPGSPDLEEPMILEGWDGPPPMCRDFDTLKYSEATYDHRPMVQNEPEQYMKEKLYPED